MYVPTCNMLSSNQINKQPNKFPFFFLSFPSPFFFLLIYLFVCFTRYAIVFLVCCARERDPPKRLKTCPVCKKKKNPKGEEGQSEIFVICTRDQQHILDVWCVPGLLLRVSFYTYNYTYIDDRHLRTTSLMFSAVCL